MRVRDAVCTPIVGRFRALGPARTQKNLATSTTPCAMAVHANNNNNMSEPELLYITDEHGTIMSVDDVS